MVERRTLTGELGDSGAWRAGRRPRDRPDDDRRHRARRAALLGVRGRVPDPRGRLRRGWGWALVGAIAIVLAAMYMLRLISAVLHEDVGPPCSDPRSTSARLSSASVVPCRMPARAVGVAGCDHRATRSATTAAADVAAQFR
jgi:hypothetical protein